MSEQATVSVKYIRAVTKPEQYAGEEGEERDLPKHIGERFAREGYVEIIGLHRVVFHKPPIDTEE